MRKVLISISLLVSLASLAQQEVSFKIERFRLPYMGKIQSVILWKGNYLCLRSNGTISFIDTLTNKVSSNIGNSFAYHFGKKFDSVKSKRSKDILFEDERFQIKSLCMGEFGGAVFFIDKKDLKKYICEATCPVMINKLNKDYIVTSSLPHLSGFTEIIKIDDPTRLLLVKPGMKFLSEEEIHSKQGAIVLLDTMGVLSASTFVVKEKLFQIVCDYKKTYLCEVNQNKLVVIDTLADKSIRPYEHNSHISEEHLLTVFKNKEITGFIDQFDNSIKIYLFDK